MRVRALQTFYYAGRDMRPGEMFDTENDTHAKVLKAGGNVEIVEPEQKVKNSGRYRRKDLRADE